MTENMQTIRDDLAFMREISTADEAAAARRSGAILTAGGVIFSAASLVAWAGFERMVAPALARWVWLAAMVVFLAVLVVRLRGCASQGVRARASGTAWSALGGAIFTIVVGFQVAAAQLGTPAVFAGLPTVIVALYGAGWTVAAAMSGRRWMTGVALGGFTLAVVLACMVASPLLYLAYAATLLLLLAAPGLVLLGRRD